MQTRRLGTTDLELTTIGLGTWAIGGPWEYGWGPQDDADSIRAIHAALDAGVNWIDTAPAYGCGHAEEVIGRALRDRGQIPILATKCGLSWDEQRRKVNCLDGEAIRAEADASLRRLGVDVIDLWQLHWPVPDEQLEEAWEAMAEVRRHGKVRYLGASNFTVEQLRRVARIDPPVALQPPYSLIQRQAEGTLFDYCRENGLGIVCYSPMYKGLLTGKYDAARVEALAPDDHRRRDPNFQGQRLKKNLALVERLRPLAAAHGRRVAQLALAWVLRRSEVTAAIVGARNEKQARETVQAGDWMLDDETLEQIDAILAELG